MYLCFQNTLIYRASNSESHPFRQEIETAISSAAEGSTVHWMYSSDKVSLYFEMFRKAFLLFL